MKPLGTQFIALAIALAVLGTAVVTSITLRHEGTSAPPATDTAQLQRLTAQMDELQRNLAAVKDALESRRPVTQVAGHVADATRAEVMRTPPASDPDVVQATRAADAEKHREYMAGIAQAFAAEKIDSAWAAGARSRVVAALESDETLRSLAPTVDCRQHTCRLEIDDAAGKVSGRMAYFVRNLVDVFPSIDAQRTEQSDGRRSMVLYLSNQQGGAQK